ncbi:MAG: CxxH/CxxC protein [Thermotaleaceae bacterium]
MEKRHGVNKMYVVCTEHLPEAIDEFVEVYEQPPDLYELDKVTFTEWTSPHTCDFCSHPPKYLVV